MFTSSLNGMSDRIMKWTSRGLFAVGVGLLAYWFGAALDAHLFQSRLAHRLEAVTSPAQASSFSDVAHATRREARTSGLVGNLEIPRLGISSMVLEGVTEQALGRGIGHVPSTAFPGEQGNVGLAAHRDTYFRSLKDVAQGDRISLRTPDGNFSYQVEWIEIVDPSRVDLLRDTEHPSLTLVTCYPFDWIGPAPLRFVVRARSTDPRAVPSTEHPQPALPASQF